MTTTTMEGNRIIGNIEGMSPQELQYVVNCSDFWLHIHSAILYGFMEGELPNQDNCIAWIEAGKKVGIVPEKDFIPPDFKLVNRIPQINQWCEKCKISHRFSIKQGKWYCNNCKSELI